MRQFLLLMEMIPAILRQLMSREIVEYNILS